MQRRLRSGVRLSAAGSAPQPRRRVLGRDGPRSRPGLPARCKSVHGQRDGRRPGAGNRRTVCPMSTGGRALRPPTGTAKASPCPCFLLPSVVLHSKRRHRANPNPFPANPLVKLLSRPRPPAGTRKTPPPRPASRARPPPPPPDVRTRLVSTRQGRVRRMIPVSVCGPCGPEVLWLLHYPASVRQGQYPCGGIRRVFLSFSVIFIGLSGCGGARAGVGARVGVTGGPCASAPARMPYPG